MREYIELEFTSALADKQLSFSLDIERVIDDVVLFCMLVGNDFLPGVCGLIVFVSCTCEFHHFRSLLVLLL
jgi:5'-3' exonuclease